MYQNLVILLVFFISMTPLGVHTARAGDTAFRTTYSVLVVGDSLSIPLGQRLEEYFKLRPGIDFHRLGKVSSGLARPDFFNWETNLQIMTSRHKPDAVFIMIGTNDTKNLTPLSGHMRTFGTTGWQKEYLRRAQRLLNICRANNPNVAIYWVGAPVMGRAQLDQAVRVVNQTLQILSTRNDNCTYIDTRDVLADSKGHYLSHTTGENGETVQLRAKDGVHVTKAGSLLIADRCLENAIFSKQSAPNPTTTKKKNDKKIFPRLAAQSQTAQWRAAAAQSSAEPANSQEDWFYSIQESSWEQYGQAIRRARMLQKKGLPARVAKADLGVRGIWHRVMIGEFSSLKRARREKKVLHAVHKLNHALIMKIRGAA